MNSAIEAASQIVTVIFFAVTISYYALLLLPRRKGNRTLKFSSITVIIAAHNEARYIAGTITAALEASFDGTKEILVVDDGSSDGTAEIARSFPGVRVLSKAHSGKADSVNTALQAATGELIAVCDADTEIAPNALSVLCAEIECEDVAGATCPILVKNRTQGIFPWMHIEQLYSSMLREIMSKVNANAVISGQFAMFRRNELLSVGGFSKIGLAEDLDCGVRLIRAGYKLGFSPDTHATTNMPDHWLWLLRQRTRWSRGPLNVLRMHLRMGHGWLDLYTLPLLVFTYVQGMVMGTFTLWKVGSGYWTYFASHGEWLSLAVAKFFLDWFSIVGLLRWSCGFFTGETPLTPVNIAGALASLLCYPLYLLCILRYDRKFDLWHALPLCFMTPFWWAITLVQTACLPEVFVANRRNIWTKRIVMGCDAPVKSSGDPVECSGADEPVACESRRTSAVQYTTDA